MSRVPLIQGQCSRSGRLSRLCLVAIKIFLNCAFVNSCKFCFLLSKSAADSVLTLQSAYKDNALVKLMCTNGFLVSKVVR